MSRYKLVSIEKSLTPQGAQDDNWYCYVIASEHSTLVGYRAGSRHEVKKIAEDCVQKMNDKYSGKVSDGYARPAFPNEIPFN